MDLADIRLAIKRQVGDESGVLIENADIDRWANEAQIDIARKTKCLEEEDTQNTVAGTREYILPVDFLSFKRVEWDGTKLDSTTLDELDLYDKDRNNSYPTREPESYYEWAKKIHLYPAPSSIKELRLYYYKTPAELVNPADIPEIPTHFHEDIVRYCLARAKELDEEDAKAQQVMDDYNIRLTQSIWEEQEEELESYPSVRLLPGDFG